MRFLICFFSLVLISACSRNEFPPVDNQEYVDTSCTEEFGTVFIDCVANDWQLPSYYEMPIDGNSGREIYAHWEGKHSVDVRIADSDQVERNQILDIQYSRKRINALLRFHVSSKHGNPIDMRDFRDGKLVFDLRILNRAKASQFFINVQCGWPCKSTDREIPFADTDRWQQIVIPVQELVQSGLDLSRIDSAVNFFPQWNHMQGVHYQLDNIRWIKGNGDTSLPYAPERDWSALAHQDLQFIYQKLLANHPGAIDNDFPEFKTWLEQGYQEALAQISKVKTEGDFLTLLHWYIAGFADAHLSIHFSKSNRVLWPGFSIRKIGSALRIDGHAERWPEKVQDHEKVVLPPIGAQLLSCDGQNPAALLEEHVLAYQFRNFEIQAVHFQHAPALFKLNGIGKREPYKECDFLVDDQRYTFTLHWQSINQHHIPNSQTRFQQDYPHYSKLEKLADNIWWIYVPSFNVSKNLDAEKALQQTFSAIAALPADATLVFDTRFNGGGNSLWADRLTNAAFGEYYYRQLATKVWSQAHAEFRVSKDNVERTPEWRPEIKSGLQAALDKGENWWIQFSGEKLDQNIDPESLPEPTRKIVLVTSFHCASACLDFVDLLRSSPVVVQLGTETFVDTRYNDIDMPPLNLPSGLGTFNYPKKIYRKRMRGYNESWQPHVNYNGDILDTEAVQAWVLRLLDSGIK